MSHWMNARTRCGDKGCRRTYGKESEACPYCGRKNPRAPIPETPEESPRPTAWSTPSVGEGLQTEAEAPEARGITKGEHIARHRELHRALDELAADYMTHNPGKYTSNSTIYELMLWSFDQITDPTERTNERSG